MSWLFSQALVAAYSPAIYSAGAPFAPLNVMPTAHKFSRHDKTMEPCDLSRFGLTCEVLTDSHGEALLTSFLAAFPVPKYPLRAKARELRGGGSSGLWVEYSRIIREVRPRFVVVENSPVLTGRGLDRVLVDLAALGFDAQWGVFSACAEGAPHTRERLFLVAHARGHRSQARQGLGGASAGERPCRDRSAVTLPVRGHDSRRSWWAAEPGMDRVADGVAHRLDRIKALGNGWVPCVGTTAWRLLNEET